MQRRASQSQGPARLAPEVNRILFVRNLPFRITAEEIFEVFGKYGAIRQIRVGDSNETRGTAFVVYEDIFDAKNACDHLSGFNVGGRYLVVYYYKTSRLNAPLDPSGLQQQSEVEALRTKVAHGEAVLKQAAGGSSAAGSGGGGEEDADAGGIDELQEDSRSLVRRKATA